MWPVEKNICAQTEKVISTHPAISNDLHQLVSNSKQKTVQSIIINVFFEVINNSAITLRLSDQGFVLFSF